MLTSSRARSGAVFSAVAVSLLLTTTTARADSPAPATNGEQITFEKPRLWPYSGSETWTLNDLTGHVICELPCSAIVGPADHYVVKGVRTDRYFNGSTYRSDALTRAVHVDALSQNLASPLVARLAPQKGNPDGAIILGVVASLILTGGAALLVSSAVESHAEAERAVGCSSCSGGAVIYGIEDIAGDALLVIGAPLGVASLVWGLSSERVKLEILPAGATAARAVTPSAVRMSFAPFGVVGSF
jgi:hypothetical protein